MDERIQNVADWSAELGYIISLASEAPAMMDRAINNRKTTLRIYSHLCSSLVEADKRLSFASSTIRLILIVHHWLFDLSQFKRGDYGTMVRGIGSYHHIRVLFVFADNLYICHF